MDLLTSDPHLSNLQVRSQSSHAYRLLRGDILAGRIGAGEKIKIAHKANELSVSPGAVREALSRLVPERLVISRDQRGFVVAPLSVEDLKDLTLVRCQVEELALRRSVKFGDLNWEATILASSHRLRATPLQTPGSDPSLRPEWVIYHQAFHAALIAACDSPRLLTLHAQLYEQSERYRGLSVHLEHDRDVPEEHEAIVAAALSRDGNRLVKLTTKHLWKTTKLIIKAVQRSGEMC